MKELWKERQLYKIHRKETYRNKRRMTKERKKRDRGNGEKTEI